MYIYSNANGMMRVHALCISSLMMFDGFSILFISCLPARMHSTSLPHRSCSVMHYDCITNFCSLVSSWKQVCFSSSSSSSFSSSSFSYSTVCDLCDDAPLHPARDWARSRHPSATVQSLHQHTCVHCTISTTNMHRRNAIIGHP